jgi:hypothetical protein
MLSGTSVSLPVSRRNRSRCSTALAADQTMSRSPFLSNMFYDLAAKRDLIASSQFRGGLPQLRRSCGYVKNIE